MPVPRIAATPRSVASHCDRNSTLSGRLSKGEIEGCKACPVVNCDIENAAIRQLQPGSRSKFGKAERLVIIVRRDRDASRPQIVSHQGSLATPSIPRIDEFDAGVNKVANVACRQSGVPGAANCGNLPIGHTDLEPAALSAGDDIGVVGCGQRVERQNPVAEFLCQ